MPQYYTAQGEMDKGERERSNAEQASAREGGDLREED